MSNTFHFGKPIECRMTPSGQLVPLTTRERLSRDLYDALGLRAKRGSARVTSIDVAAGTITVEAVR